MSLKEYDLLKNMYLAFNAREIDSILTAMHPEVIWPNGWEGGYVHGHQGIRDYWPRQWAAIDPHVEPVGFRTDKTGVIIVRVHQIVHDKDGIIISDSIVEHHYRFANDLIKRMETHKS